MRKSTRDNVLLADQLIASTLGSGVDVANRTIYLVGDVNPESTYKFMVGLNILDCIEGPIRVLLSSSGGSEPDGYAIYDSLLLCRNTVEIDCFGSCMSIAALILQAGAVRLLAPDCRFMIHNGHLEFGGQVDATKMVTVGEEIGRNNLRYQEVLANTSGLPLEQVTGLCERETYLSAQEAVDLGFADGVIGPPPSRSVKKTAKKRK